MGLCVDNEIHVVAGIEQMIEWTYLQMLITH